MSSTLPGPRDADPFADTKRQIFAAMRVLHVHGLDGGATLTHAGEHHPELTEAVTECAAAILELITGVTACPGAPSMAAAFTSAGGEHLARALAAFERHRVDAYDAHYLAANSAPEATA